MGLPPAEQHDIPETIEGVRCSFEVPRGHGTRGSAYRARTVTNEKPIGVSFFGLRSLGLLQRCMFEVAGSAERMSWPPIATNSGGLGRSDVLIYEESSRSVTVRCFCQHLHGVKY